MELTAVLAFLSDKTPEFIVGAILGLALGIFLAYVYLLPRLIKSSNAALTAQVKLLSDQVALQTSHITHLEEQVKGLQSELEPYKEFARKHIENAMAINAG
jgi:predicted small secreted protein